MKPNPCIKPYVGLQLYIQRINSRECFNGGCEVTKVGRKYFYVRHSKMQTYQDDLKFYLESWEEVRDYRGMVNHQLFITNSTFNDHQERFLFLEKFGKIFRDLSHPDYTLEQCRAVGKILKIEVLE